LEEEVQQVNLVHSLQVDLAEEVMVVVPFTMQVQAEVAQHFDRQAARN